MTADIKTLIAFLEAKLGELYKKLELHESTIHAQEIKILDIESDIALKIGDVKKKQATLKSFRANLPYLRLALETIRDSIAYTKLTIMILKKQTSKSTSKSK